ncbi:MAG: hypothetical protein ACRD0V_05035 [Acidimicrobiales bacterium]
MDHDVVPCSWQTGGPFPLASDTIVDLALPSIQRHLGLGPGTLQ